MKRDDVGKEPFSIYFSSMVAFGNQKKENKNEVRYVRNALSISLFKIF